MSKLSLRYLTRLQRPFERSDNRNKRAASQGLEQTLTKVSSSQAGPLESCSHCSCPCTRTDNKPKYNILQISGRVLFEVVAHSLDSKHNLALVQVLQNRHKARLLSCCRNLAVASPVKVRHRPVRFTGPHPLHNAQTLVYDSSMSISLVRDIANSITVCYQPEGYSFGS